MVTICLQCGDVGFENAYVYCVKCLKFAVHRYCLPEIPKTYDEFVRWICDNCEAVSSGSAPRKPLFDAQDEICTEPITISQLPSREDENYGPTELILQPPVHENLGDARLADDNCLSGVEPNANNEHEQERFDDDIPPGFEPHGLEATKVKDKRTRRSSSWNQFRSGHRRRFSDRSSRFPPMRNDERKKHRFRGHSSRQTHEERRPMRNPVCERQKERVKEESLIIPSRSNVNEGVSQQTHEGRHVHKTPSIDKSCGYSLQVKPVVDPIWRGRFDIVNKKDAKFEGFVAHLSSRACQPVIEEAGLLPVLLQLEMVPKSTVWPMSFQTTKPTDDNIALYFFPADTRYEKVFDRLVNEMSREELALRATTKNAELLIFSSTELETELWRFKNKYFIWGVFKGKR